MGGNYLGLLFIIVYIGGGVNVIKAQSSPVQEYDSVGCFAYKSQLFSSYFNNGTYQTFQPKAYSTNVSNPTQNECAKKCADLSDFTYAGLQAGFSGLCYCFNNLNDMRKTNATLASCMTCITVRGGTNYYTNVGCRTTNPYMMVMTVCKMGFFNPPLCMDRAKASCLDGNFNFATARYDGQCEQCGVDAYMNAKYPDIENRCDVLSGKQIFMDFRYQAEGVQTPSPNNIDSLIVKNSPSYLTYSMAQMVPIGAALKDYYINPIGKQTPGSPYRETLLATRLKQGIMIFGRVPGFSADPNQLTYISKYMVRGNAAGGFFFSLWNFINDIYTTYPQADKNAYKQARLFNKELVTILHAGVTEVANVYFPIPAGALLPMRFGFHTIDAAREVGATVSDQTTITHQGITCELIYSYAHSLNTYYPFSHVFRNEYSQDVTSPNGWKVGDSFYAAYSNRGYQPDNYIRSVRGLYDADYHAFDCQMKFLMEVACPDRCVRQQCDTTFTCTQGCVSGYYGSTCSTPCPAGKFGMNCAQACSQYCSGVVCNAYTGACLQGCTNGRFGPMCDQTCQSGFYGTGCTSKCGAYCQTANLTSSQFICDLVVGNCTLGCLTGNNPPLCTDPCPNGNFGDGCKMVCGQCKNNAPCDKVTGVCAAGCTVGYMPPSCKCKSGTWGPNCTKTCGLCNYGRPCNPDSGVCTDSPIPGTEPNQFSNASQICANNTQPPMCVCKSGLWGDNCDKSCGKCLNGFCVSTSGACFIGCAPGYQGQYCTAPCNAGTWGAGCSNKCGSCKNNVACNATTGNCDGGCSTGWAVPFCATCARSYCGLQCDQTCGYCSNPICDAEDCACLAPPLPAALMAALPASLMAMPVPLTAVGSPSPASSGTGASAEAGTSATGTGTAGTGTAGTSGTAATGTAGTGTSSSGTATGVASSSIASMASSVINSAQSAALTAAAQSACMPGFQAPQCKCKTGFFGPNCDQPCGHCMAGCDYYNGTCIGGCTSGYQNATCTQPCSNLNFGPNCRFLCGNCFNSSGCTAEDGICNKGCDAGYMLPTCICPLGIFGPNCDRKCGNCATGTTCSFLDGSCGSGCMSGWKMPYCNCSLGTYKLDCSGKCGQCLVGNECDLYNGTCVGGCKAGFQAPLCNDICLPGTYGPGCLLKCGQCKDCAVCDPVNGTCPSGCNPGYNEPYCTSQCQPGFYGAKCTSKCGYCYNQAACSSYDGFCDIGCAMGYKSPLCQEACANKTWGFNCQNSCGQCANGSNCNFLDGTCPGDTCQTNYVAPYCVQMINPTAAPVSVCPDGFYAPPVCRATCGNCLAGATCDGQSGYCKTGCDPGFKPILCADSCTDGLFGSNCLETCGKCNGTNGCRKTDGHCIQGCETGFFGDTCKFTSQQAAVQAASDALRLAPAMWMGVTSAIFTGSVIYRKTTFGLYFGL